MADYKIKNGDIVLTGVALSDIYINKDNLLLSGHDIGESNNKIQMMLQNKTSEHFGDNGCQWSTEVTNVDIFTELSKSHSAYRTLSKREYLAVCKLGAIKFDIKMASQDRLNKLLDGFGAVSDILSEEQIVLKDVEIRFYEFGNVTITGVFRLRDVSLSLDDYKVISDFAHVFFGSALRETVSQMIGVYCTVMREVDASTAIPIEMLNVPLDIDLKIIKPIEQIKELKYVIDFSIRYHIIYDSEMKRLEDIVEPFHDILCGEWELERENQLKLKNASIYFGWTHSLVLLEDYEACRSIKEFEMYRFPLEVVLTNWGALHSLSKRLEKGRAKFLKAIDDEERHSFKKKKYSQIADEIREFSLKVKRILQSLDSYTVTNNPMHYKLIDMQQEVFLEHKSVDRINRQLELVANLVDELSVREKARVESRLNKVLTMLTMLTVIDIARTAYEVAMSGLHSISWTGGISGLMLIILLSVYKYEPGRRKKRNVYEEN